MDPSGTPQKINMTIEKTTMNEHCDFPVCHLRLLEGAWRIIPVSKWLVSPINKPFSPFGRRITLLRGVTNHGYLPFTKWDPPSNGVFCPLCGSLWDLKQRVGLCPRYQCSIADAHIIASGRRSGACACTQLGSFAALSMQSKCLWSNKSSAKWSPAKKERPFAWVSRVNVFDFAPMMRVPRW